MYLNKDKEKVSAQVKDRYWLLTQIEESGYELENLMAEK
jgi:hypothetical protein